MKKIEKINLEISFFVKRLNAYIENVNEINDETTKLLIETNKSVSKLRKNAQFRDFTSNESGFIDNLNNETFECRPYIVCRLCSDHLPLSTQDFALHCQKADHRDRENAQTCAQRHSPNGYENNLMRTTSSIPMNDTKSVNGGQMIQQKSTTSRSSSAHHRSIDNIEKSRSDTSSVPPISTQKLLNAIDIEKVFIAIPAVAVDLVYRMVQRCFTELEIQAQLTRHFKELDSSLEVMPFGSATYGFGGSHTNFNILVNADAAMQKPYETFQSIEMLFKAHGLQTHFKVLSSIKGDRVQRKRLEAIHSVSGILCSIQVNSNSELAESSQTIRNYIMHSPICYHLIAYVRAWQIAVNEMAAQNGLRYAFRFNTYIISVLVIFFLQMKHNFPKLSDVPQSQVKSIDFVPKIDEKGRNILKSVAEQFFEFYGRVYDKCKLISLDIGRWQNRRLDKHQSVRTLERQKLEASMKSNPQNWEKCTMFVQDIKSPGVNITAEITEVEVDNFRALCRMFTSTTLYGQSIEKYLLELSQMQSTSSASKMNNNGRLPHESPSRSSQKLGNEVAKKPDICDAAKSTDDRCDDVIAHGKMANVDTQPLSPSTTKWANAINIDKVLTLTRVGMGEIQSRSPARIKSEQEIIDKFSFLLTTFDPEITVVPFGSVTFGFGGPKTDFNILITEGTSLSSSEIRTLIEDLLKTTGLQQDFKLLSHIPENRAHCEQLEVLHKDTNIVCGLNFNTKSVLLQSEQAAKIIRDYMILHPMCKQLIAYVKAWQNVLNEESSKSGSVAFNMNSYIIAVLVIFYLQLNHDVPIVAELSSAIANGSKYLPRKSFDEFVNEFFKFYGQTFEPKMHVISVHVGKLQQREQAEQKLFTSARKSSRDGIAACPMCVQDIVSSSTNITAEITESEVDNFVRMCQMFSQHVLKFDDKCLSSQMNPIPMIGQRTLNAKAFECKSLIEQIENGIMKSRVPAVLEMRQRAELEIIPILIKYLCDFMPSSKLHPFGSAQYGIKFACTNFNVLIVDEEATRAPNDFCDRFFLECKIRNADNQKQFKEICQVEADRAMEKQISMVHIKSGIQCLVLFQSNNKIAQSTDIIKRFANEPLCNFLITFVRKWQDVLNQLNIARFEFNTYTISILVIFFLQMNHQFPTIDQTSVNICSTVSNFKPILKDFFAFYGNRYQIWNHVISTEIGRWQQRQLPSEPTYLTPAQKRLRAGIEESPANWTNCAMCVQDLIRPDVNVTAEITKEAAEKFQEMCQTFAEKLK